MAKKAYKTLELKVKEAIIPIKIYEEWRTTVKISINNRYASLRMPNYLPSIEKINQTERAKKWVIDQIGQRENLYNSFIIKKYNDGSQYTFRDKSYTIIKLYETRKTNSCKIEHDQIKIKLSSGIGEREEATIISTLLSRGFAQMYYPLIEDKVHRLNELYFNSKLNSVKLKYNKSNWGSCSNKGNINLSTRLLFAPESVIDYVIIHELAHTKEMNHSSNFWKLVSTAFPKYKEAEKWLRVNNHLCDY